jgi:signal peptidase I
MSNRAARRAVVKRRSLILIVAVVLVAASATAAFAALSSGPTGACFNPLATHYSNQQGSMSPTLAIGDLILVGAVQTGTPFTRGEIVVFNAPASFGGGTSSTPFIKRIIGLPGETVSLANGRVVVNGTPLDEPYLAAGTVTEPQGTPMSSVLGAAELFVLGDSRANSADSRAFGAVPIASVTGHATAICSPDSRKAALP